MDFLKGKHEEGEEDEEEKEEEEKEEQNYFSALGRSGAFFYDTRILVFAATWHRDLLTSIFYIQDEAIYHWAKAPVP